jgi:hypothetical protein
LSDKIKLTKAEEEVYEMMGDGEIMCKQVPHKISGAIPGLINKGLVIVFKKRVSPFRNKKAKFIRRK